MASEQIVAAAPLPESRSTITSDAIAREGIAAGLCAAGAIAVWFFLVDLAYGRPLYTPTVLGTALFRGGAGIDSPATLAVSGEMVLMFTWVHCLAFGIVGGLVAWLLSVVERNPNLGFGIMLLFVYLEGAFLVVSFLFAETVIHALAWPAVVVGNLLAAAVMALYFWKRHPNLLIRP